MAYSSEADILKMIPQAELAQLTAESGEDPDSQVVAEAISQADAEIDSYVGVKYPVPLTAVPEQIKALSVDLAIYHLYSRRSVVPPVRLRKYEDGVAFLKQVAAGQVTVPGIEGEPHTAELDSKTRLFSRDTLGEW
jgi:phage gp36-like protein